MAGSSPWVTPPGIQAFQAVWKQNQQVRVCHLLPQSSRRAGGKGIRAGEARDREMGQQQGDTKGLLDLNCQSSTLAQGSPAWFKKGNWTGTALSLWERGRKSLCRKSLWAGGKKWQV